MYVDHLTFIMSQSNRSALFSKQSTRQPYTVQESNDTINIDNTQLQSVQQSQLSEQDNRLDDILNGVTKLKYMSNDINNELLLHNTIINELDDTIDHTDSRIKKSTSGIVEMSRSDSGGWGSFCTMVVLLVLIVLLISTNWFCVILNPHRC